MSDGILVGVDGGGSKTVVLVADRAGQVLGRGSAGSANYQAIGIAQAGSAVTQALAAACRAAGIVLEATPLANVCLGLAGVDRPADRLVWEAWSRAQWPGVPTLVLNDAELVLAAGTPAGWGVAVICGTGSIAYGRDSGPHRARAGGWGSVLGDEGSGYSIGLAALRAVARADDQRAEPTVLTDRILQHWALATPQALIQRVYVQMATPAEIAALAPLVDQAARSGDQVAQAILVEAAEELALAATTVARQLQLQGPIPLALAGGVFVKQPERGAAVVAAAAQRGWEFAPVTIVDEPARGAVILAAQSWDPIRYATYAQGD